MASVLGPIGRRPRPIRQIGRLGRVALRVGWTWGAGGGTCEGGEAGVVTVLATGEETD